MVDFSPSTCRPHGQLIPKLFLLTLQKPRFPFGGWIYYIRNCLGLQGSIKHLHKSRLVRGLVFYLTLGRLKSQKIPNFLENPSKSPFQAQSSADLTTVEMPSLQLDTKHQDSLQIIGYLDSHQVCNKNPTPSSRHPLEITANLKVHIGPQEVERPEEFQSLDQPRFVRPLSAKIECMENDPVHFEARLQPANDVKMTVEWWVFGAWRSCDHFR